MMPDAQQPLSTLPRMLMLGIAFGQGIALFLLWRALANNVWPSQTPIINFPLWTLAIASPTLMLLCLNRENLPRSLKAVGAFSTVLAAAALYVGWQASPWGEFPIGPLLTAYVITMLIAGFKGLMYCQLWIGRASLDYGALFTHSWRNFLVAAFSALLTGGVAVILALWGNLFSAIGIGWFKALFESDWFLFPMLASAFGVGVLIFRQLVGVIDGVAKLLEGLMRLLLPLTALVLVIFLGALPFTGLQPLWETGSGTALLLWLSAFMLFFVNAVYQTGDGSPYPPWVHRALSAVLTLLPIVSALALYGLALRINEYGWTVQRCWAFTVLALSALFAVGYAGCVIRWRQAWPSRLGRANTALGGLVLAVMVLVNSPLFDFRAIALASQMQRVEAGEVELRDFDFSYARRHLARPGHLRLQALIAEHEASDPELARIIKATERGQPSGQTFDELWARLNYRPGPFEAPPGLREAASATVFGRVSQRHTNPTLIRIDLDEDGDFEYVLLSQHRDNDNLVEAELFFREGDAWKNRALVTSRATPDDVDVTASLREGEIKRAEPQFKDLKLGELRFHQTFF